MSCARSSLAAATDNQETFTVVALHRPRRQRRHGRRPSLTLGAFLAGMAVSTRPIVMASRRK
jgi:hypothetical protein